MEDTKITITVRFVTNTKNGKCWFEERMTNGSFVKIPSTEMVCEGNSRHALSQEIERRRQLHLSIFLKTGQEETFQVVP